MGEKIFQFQVPGYITKVTTMNRWWRISVDTQENVSSGDIATILGLMRDQYGNEQLGYFTFSLAPITQEAIEQAPPIIEGRRPEDQKTPAQELHTELWLLWKAHPEGFADSESHYRSYMAKLKEWVRNKRI